MTAIRYTWLGVFGAGSRTGYAAMQRLLILTISLALAISQAQTTAATAGRSGPFSDSAGVNLPAQRIGPNDLLSISVYDAPEFTRTVRVSADGMIILPLMKTAIQAAGLLPSEVEPKLAEALRDQDLLNNATVIVTVAEYNSRPITVSGAVRTPLVFQAVGRVRLTDALTRAGGLAPEAASDADVISPDGSVRKIPLKALLDSSVPELNVELSGGEEIRVPAAGRIYILGNVKTSGAFAIQDQTDASVLKFVTLAGGFNSTAPKVAYIIRVEPNTQVKHEIEIPLKDMVDRKSPDLPLQAHDILYVPENRKHQAAVDVEKVLALAAGAAIIVRTFGW